jgi:hypothetical protein
VGGGARGRQTADAVSGEKTRIAGAVSCSADVEPAATANKTMRRSIADTARADRRKRRRVNSSLIYLEI